MKNKKYKTFLMIFGMIAATCLAMTYSNRQSPAAASAGNTQMTNGEIVSLSAKLTQDKIQQGSDGTVSMSLTLAAESLPEIDSGDTRHVDMVVVLDRSGSMQGQKLTDACRAVNHLISCLGPNDRIALISYDDGVTVNSGLVQVNESERERLVSLVNGISPGGGTNLGSGLQTGIRILRNSRNIGNTGKILLISDGLANQGITDAAALGNMASIAPEHAFSISTVGVGSDFNERLMTALADRGRGAYHYLENPETFASVFEKEFHAARAITAAALTVELPLPTGVSLVHAGGYPIEVKNGRAIFHPADLVSGQSRNLFLQFNVPAGELKTYEIGRIRLLYRHGDRQYETTIDQPFTVSCIADPKAALASIDKQEWSRKVLQEDYNRLKDEVSLDIKNGNENEAMGKIDTYYQAQRSINDTVGSLEVTRNLEKDLSQLRETVKETFAGAPAAVERKQKMNAKALQFEGYKGRRAIQ